MRPNVHLPFTGGEVSLQPISKWGETLLGCLAPKKGCKSLVNIPKRNSPTLQWLAIVLYAKTLASAVLNRQEVVAAAGLTVCVCVLWYYFGGDR